MRNQVKHLLILISLLLLSSLLTSCEKKEETLYRWETSSGFEWKKFGEKGTQEKYEGEVSWSSKPNGVGTLIFLNGDKYIGEFDDGRKDGLGTYTWSNHEDMEKYIGEFTNGEFGKKGKIYYKNGQIYEGEVFGNEKDLDYGEGVKTLPDGSKYEGVWSRRKDDIISKWKIKGYDKYGEIVLEIYEGNGKGLYVYTGGNKYEGEFKDGEQDGQGTFTLSDGTKFVGEWKDNKPWNVTIYDKDGNILGKYVNGKSIKQ